LIDIPLASAEHVSEGQYEQRPYPDRR
jgi:hypothetical protein